MREKLIEFYESLIDHHNGLLDEVSEKQQSGDFNAEDKMMVKSLKKQIRNAKNVIKELNGELPKPNFKRIPKTERGRKAMAQALKESGRAMIRAALEKNDGSIYKKDDGTSSQEPKE